MSYFSFIYFFSAYISFHSFPLSFTLLFSSHTSYPFASCLRIHRTTPSSSLSHRHCWPAHCCRRCTLCPPPPSCPHRHRARWWPVPLRPLPLVSRRSVPIASATGQAPHTHQPRHPAHGPSPEGKCGNRGEGAAGSYFFLLLLPLSTGENPAAFAQCLEVDLGGARGWRRPCSRLTREAGRRRILSPPLLGVHNTASKSMSLPLPCEALPRQTDRGRWRRKGPLWLALPLLLVALGEEAVPAVPPSPAISATVTAAPTSI
jgi:hypothetical protein